MKNNKLEPQLNLNKNQILNLIETYLSKNDPNELFEHMLNILMKSERSVFLSNKQGNKGNGYRTVKKLGIGSKLKLSIPRDRLGIFKPLILGILNDQDEKLYELTYNLYGKGLTTRQIGDLIEEIYGKNYSKSTISRITEKFHENIKKWLNRKLDAVYPMIMIDALHIKVKRDTVATEAFYVVLGLKQDFTREIIGVFNFPTESASGWQEVLENLRKRGVVKVGLFVSDNLKSLDESISKVFPESDHQKCVLHFKRNLLRKIRPKHRADFAKELN